MTVLRQLATGIIYSNLYIALVAALMTWQTFHYFPYSGSSRFIWFIGAATFFSYNFHWFLTAFGQGQTKREEWSRRHSWLLAGFSVSGLIMAFFLFPDFRIHWLAIGVGAVVTLLYTLPKIPFLEHWKYFRYGKTLLLAITWTYATTALPLLMSEDWSASRAVLLMLNRFLLVFCICMIFDLRDQEEDRAAGLKSLPVLVGRRTLIRIYIVTLSAHLITLLLLWNAGFSNQQLLHLAAPGFVLALLTPRALRDTSDIVYYFYLDGLMMFSAVLDIINPF